MSILEDIGKAFKGSEEYEKAKAEKKAKRAAKRKIQREKLDASRKRSKAIKAKRPVYKSKAYRSKPAPSVAERKARIADVKAKRKAKDKPGIISKIVSGIATDIKEASKGSEEYQKAQTEKKAKRAAKRKIQREKLEATRLEQKENREKLAKKTLVKTYSDGGKVEGGGLFNFPSSDARDR